MTIQGHDSAVGRRLRRPSAPDVPSADDPLDHLRHHAHEAIFTRLGNRLVDSPRDATDLQPTIRREVERYVDESRIPFTAAERLRLIADVVEDLTGLGPIRRFVDDEQVSEIMVNATTSIYVERHGRLVDTGKRFHSEAHLRRVIDRIVSPVGRRVDEASPMVDARLPDGSRVNAVIPPLAVDGTVLTIRKFSTSMLGIGHLVACGTMTDEMADHLESCVRERRSIVVSGGTGSGKTTLLNVLSSFIPADERIITIEDAVELRLQHPHIIRLESRPANVEGRGAITIRDLVRNALRMRPDRIIVGEVRGAEALDMLQAMNTGHDGSLTTLHANTPRDAISRIETMVLMAGTELPLVAIRDQIAAAVDVIVQTSRLPDGSRRITHITDIGELIGGSVELNDRYVLDIEPAHDTTGRLFGRHRRVG